ncbi:MAG: translocation/assembly module TamB domain-containing protein [Gammaproteobacteria bacterium]|nr:translocation/assembly module TamB domain-containing protein [Gammaproteobacteria bacterium]
MKRQLIPALTLALVAALAAGAAALLYTGTGLRWAFDQLQHRVPGQLSVEGFDGRLAGPLTISGLRYEDGKLSVRADRIMLRWRPGRLFDGLIVIDALELGAVEVTIKPAPDADRGGAFDFSLPFPVELRRMTVAPLVVALPEREPLTVDTLEFSVTARDEIVHLSALRLAAPWLRLEAEGELPLNPRRPLQAALRWETAVRDTAMAGTGTLGGTWRNIRADLHLARPLGLNATAQIDTGLGADGVPSRWSLNGAVESFAPSALLPQAPAGEVTELTVRAEGGGDTISADSKLIWRDARHGNWALGLAAERSGTQWEFPRIHIESLDGAAKVEGSARLQVADGVPAGFALDARWRDLAWPPDKGGIVSSPQGELHAEGTPERYDFTLSGALHPPHAPPLRLAASGHGDRAGATVTELTGTWLDGTWSGQGMLAWSPGLRWDATLAAQGVNPAVYRKGFDGRIDAAGRVHGEYAGGALALGIDVDGVEGTLRGYPLSAQGRIALQEGELRIDDLRLRSGDATLDGSARLGAQWQLDWRLHAPELAALHPDLAGELRTQGSVSGPPDALRTRIELEGRRLSFRDLRADGLRLNADVDLAPAGRWEAHAEAAAAGLRDLPRARIMLDLSGDSQDHALLLTAEQGEYRFEQHLSGMLRDGVWQARLHDGELVLAALGAYTQETEAGLTLAPEAFSLQDWCWRRDTAQMCMAGASNPGAGLHGELRWRQIDLADLSALLPASAVKLGGSGTGSLRLDYSAGRLRAVDARLVATGGALSYTVPGNGSTAQAHTVAYRTASLEIGGGEDGLRAGLRVDIADGARLEAEAQLPEWYAAEPQFSPQQALTGRIDLDLNDLTPISLLLPDLVPGGEARLQAHAMLSGSLDDPRIGGRLDATVATLAVARLGLSLREVNLGLQAEQDRWRLDGALRSGAGRLEIEGDGVVHGRDSWEGTLALKGEQVEIVRLPSAEVTASPDVTLRLTPGDLEFSGTLAIPAARIEPFAAEAATGVSEDVVLVGGEARDAPPRLRVHGELLLILGDEVRVAGKGLEGRLAGRLRILMNTPENISGQGEIRIVEGKYRAYGQNLSIEQGRALYAGGSIDNPALDVIASRQRGDDIKVGVRVTGTADHPLVRLFSDPAMDDGDVLSYLVLGRPLDQASATEGRALYQAATSLALVGGEALATRIGGVFNLSEVSIEAGEVSTDTALVLGKSLSPRLYVRYIQGLVENTAAFQIRYRLSDKWTLETESGTRVGSGADLIYSFER